MNAKDSVKILKRAGIALIALPDPISTPIGIAFIVAARFISKRIEANFLKSVTETIRYYLGTIKPIPADMDKADENAPEKKKMAKSPASAAHIKYGTVKHTQKDDENAQPSNVITVRVTDSNKSKASATSPVTVKQQSPAQPTQSKETPAKDKKGDSSGRNGIQVPKAPLRKSAGSASEVKRADAGNEPFGRQTTLVQRTAAEKKSKSRNVTNNNHTEQGENKLTDLKIDREKLAKRYKTASAADNPDEKDSDKRVKPRQRKGKTGETKANEQQSETPSAERRVMDAAALRRRYGVSALGQRNHK